MKTPTLALALFCSSVAVASPPPAPWISPECKDIRHGNGDLVGRACKTSLNDYRSVSIYYFGSLASDPYLKTPFEDIGVLETLYLSITFDSARSEKRILKFFDQPYSDYLGMAPVRPLAATVIPYIPGKDRVWINVKFSNARQGQEDSEYGAGMNVEITF
jgi:hypothetical protein